MPKVMLEKTKLQQHTDLAWKPMNYPSTIVSGFSATTKGANVDACVNMPLGFLEKCVRASRAGRGRW